MKFTFKLRTTAYDLWRLSMIGIYHSMMGLINVIFTIAMILLALKFWGNGNFVIKILLIISICLFTIIQPGLIFLRARKQVSTFPEEMEIGFDEVGVHVKADDQTSDLKWKQIRGITKKPGMLIVFSTAKHGFILTDKVLGSDKEAFFQYVTSKSTSF